jgi:hypothetical protein
MFSLHVWYGVPLPQQMWIVDWGFQANSVALFYYTSLNVAVMIDFVAGGSYGMPLSAVAPFVAPVADGAAGLLHFGSGNEILTLKWSNYYQEITVTSFQSCSGGGSTNTLAGLGVHRDLDRNVTTVVGANGGCVFASTINVQ